MTIPDVSTPVVILTLYNHLGLGLVRSLGRLGVPVYCVHPDPAIPAMHSRYAAGKHAWDVVGSSPDATVEYLLRLGKSLGRRSILVHTSDDTATLVADNAEALKERFIFPDVPGPLIRSLTSKREMFFLAKKLGIPTAETTFPQSRADVVESLGEVRFPVMLKGIDGQLLEQRTGKKMVIVRDRDGLLDQYDRLEDPARPNLMLQEYIPGGEDSVWMFNGYFNERSECLAAFTGRKIRQAPAYTGFTSLGVCLRNDAVEDVTKEFMKRVGYRGMLDIGYRYDARDGTYKVLDVNPRIGATFRLFVAENGLDVARAAYLDLTGQAVPASRFREGRKWLVEDRDLVSSLRYYRDGVLSPGEWLRSFRGVEETAYFAADDPAPFFRMVWNHLKKKLSNRGTGPAAP
jgi:predicted ATP-grasp superfamily ATP-dependent carboligase